MMSERIPWYFLYGHVIIHIYSSHQEYELTNYIAKYRISPFNISQQWTTLDKLVISTLRSSHLGLQKFNQPHAGCEMWGFYAGCEMWEFGPFMYAHTELVVNMSKIIYIFLSMELWNSRFLSTMVQGIKTGHKICDLGQLGEHAVLELLFSFQILGL